MPQSLSSTTYISDELVTLKSGITKSLEILGQLEQVQSDFKKLAETYKTARQLTEKAKSALKEYEQGAKKLEDSVTTAINEFKETLIKSEVQYSARLEEVARLINKRLTSLEESLKKAETNAEKLVAESRIEFDAHLNELKEEAQTSLEALQVRIDELLADLAVTETELEGWKEQTEKKHIGLTHRFNNEINDLNLQLTRAKRRASTGVALGSIALALVLVLVAGPGFGFDLQQLFVDWQGTPAVLEIVE